MIIKHPYVTEKATALIDKENALQFIVDLKASKKQIKEEVEKLYGVKVVSVNTMITANGRKKATVKLSSEYKAEEIATRLGLF
ncbi:MAG: 50S ribosomal protein L23 [Methanocellales archaeon]